MMVLAVHPWLMSLRGDILKAKAVALGYPSSMPTEFMVKNGPEHMMIEEKEYWIQGRRGGPRSSTVPASILHRLRRNR